MPHSSEHMLEQKSPEVTSHSTPSPGICTKTSALLHSRRKALKTLLITGGSAVGVGAIGSIICNISHCLKLREIQQECDKAMRSYCERRQGGASDFPYTDSWIRETEGHLNDYFIERHFHDSGIRSQGSLKFFLGDFDLDEVKANEVDVKGDEAESRTKWLGRCGGIARYIVVEAAKNGFSDVRMYFASHPRKYTSICPFTMHYYGVVGRNDVEELDERYFVLNLEKEKCTFQKVDEENIFEYLRKDYTHGDITMCMQSKRESFSDRTTLA